MRSDTLNAEPPRSTAYYYGDLERLKRPTHNSAEDPNQLSEYVESNEIVNDAPISEVPPLRDRPIRQWSLPEYSTPEGVRKLPGETYSTAGTFPMPEPKEKEPLLAELEVVGRLPLTQLESTGVRRSRSWYLCCPDVGEEEVSRQSSWRYSSLRPVTQPPAAGVRSGMSFVMTAPPSSTDSVAALRAERAALARSLDAERQRAQTQARAHEARLAELHGVIAELMRRRDLASTRHIPEETSEHTDECESTTQPAGELDNDADLSRTDQNESSSRVSLELTNPRNDAEETSGDAPNRLEKADSTECESEMDDARQNFENCLTATRDQSRTEWSSCERARSTDDAPLSNHHALHGYGEAKLASRVRLKKTEEVASHAMHGNDDDAWCLSMAERLSLDVCAQADLREALVAASTDSSSLQSLLASSVARVARLEADLIVTEQARDMARDTAHKLWVSCACHESATVSLCGALRAADRALEAYDVLLALAETTPGTAERESAEQVGRAILSRLEDPEASISGSLLSPGPWLEHTPLSGPSPPWSAAQEASLRAHAARLKAETAEHRAKQPLPPLFSYHDTNESEVVPPVNAVSTADMEAAVMLQEIETVRSERAAALAALCKERARLRALTQLTNNIAAADHTRVHQSNSTRSRSRRHPREERHWLEASETDL